jgi:hypothetical protein
MSLIKLNNRAVKDVTQFGSISSLGSLTHISTATASSSASIEFTLGDYKEYQFYFVNIHPQTNIVKFTVNFRDGESLFDATKTTTYFRARHDEAGTTGQLGYDTGEDLAQSTGEHTLCASTGNDNDQCLSGILKLFNPSSTTFVKHFIADMSDYRANDYNAREMTAGYCNTTSAIDGIRFQMSSGNIDAGQILLFGVN